MCKNLITKLSATTDIQFKSDIQSLLSSLLPLNHKSGLNISGRFSAQYSQIETETKDSATAEGTQISDSEFNTYSNFWKLIKLLVHPHSLF